MPHRIEVFTAGCPLCQEAVSIVEVGKCGGCSLEVYDVADPRVQEKVRRYGVRAVPTIIIDGKIRVVGVPDFPWFCSEEFYRFLEERYLLRAAGEE
jgi:glutaredoxin